MKKFVFGLITGAFLFTPILAYSAPSLAARLNGRILLAVEDMGRTYYVADGYRYLITRATAQKVFEKLALGISNKNLSQIPLKEVAVEPEVLPEPIYVDKIVYVDRYLEKQCPSVESYKNEINDLERQVEILKTNWDIKGVQIIDQKSALKKEYGLKINGLQKQLLDTQTQYNNAEQIVKNENSGWDATMTARLINSFKQDKQARINDLNRTISVLQNELERKLLELE